MGKLIYGANVNVDMDDRSLFHLDVLLASHRDLTFQLHVMLGAARDGNLLSMSVGRGVPMAMEYGNGPELELDAEVIARATEDADRGGFVSLPFAFQSNGGTVDHP